MDCPACKDAMITLELQDVEVDYCPACGGIWLDSGELEALLGDSGKVAQLFASFKVDPARKENPRACPICDKKMQKIVVGQSHPTLLIDKCAKGDGLWLDKGELRGILNRAKLDEGSRIHELLAGVFGYDKKDLT